MEELDVLQECHILIETKVYGSADIAKWTVFLSFLIRNKDFQPIDGIITMYKVCSI